MLDEGYGGGEKRLKTHVEGVIVDLARGITVGEEVTRVLHCKDMIDVVSTHDRLHQLVSVPSAATAMLVADMPQRQLPWHFVHLFSGSAT
jgi:hypothetical protein